MITPSNTNFKISSSLHSISLANDVSDNVEVLNDPFMQAQKFWLTRGMQGGMGCCCKNASYGMGQVDSNADLTEVANAGFDFGTALGTSGFWLLVGGGAFLYWMLFAQPSARERRTRISAARQRYQREVSGIKADYTRTRRKRISKATSGGINSRYSECDIGPSGKVWYKGAWRKPENVEAC